MPRRLKIGLSVSFFHSDPNRNIFKGKTLLYVEQSLTRWVMSEGALVFPIPSVNQDDPVLFKDFVSELDGLILQGGSDVCPITYGEKPLKPEWSGDAIRDVYEISLFREFLSARKPVLGVCRGLQLINVACGGTLYQDITTQVPNALRHRDAVIYDKNVHEIKIEPSSGLKKLFPNQTTAKVNSVHHQAIKDVSRELSVEATSEKDGLIEAIRHKLNPNVFAIQWHPEFQDPADRSLLSPTPILQEFLKQCSK